MAGSALMSIGLRAMQAQYAALQTTGHNISNANTVGYSRQQVEFATSGGQYTGAGFFGKGVDVAAVTRTHNAFLTREMVATGSMAAADGARSSQLAMLERVFGLGEAGIGYAASQFFNAFADVAARPSDLPSRQVAIARAEQLAARLRDAAGQVDTLQTGVTTEIRAHVAKANELGKQIARLNDLIAKTNGSGQTPNDLLDQRDAAVAELGRIVPITTVAADDGTLSVFIGGGQRFVLGADAARLEAMADPFDPSRLGIGIALGTASAVALPDSMFAGGGAIGGLLRVQNDDLVAARNLLGQMAAAIAGAVNAQQALGIDLTGNAGAALFGAVSPLVMPSSNNSGSAPVGVVIADHAALLASDYELYADPDLPAGSYRLTRLSDGAVSTVASGDTVDGFTLTIGPPAPAARDRFLLQPVGSAARNLQLALNDPRGLAAASPVVATATPGNTGTGTVAGVRAASSALNPNLTATFSFTGGGAYSWTLVDTTGALPTTNGTGTWTPGQPIALNGFELSLQGVPATGDSFTVSRTTFAGADNGNANALLALGQSLIVGARPGVPGASVTDAYANLLAEVGVRVQGAALAANQSYAMAADAQAQVAAQSGVNLDEEAARLIQFQQAYQAAAKVLQIAQSLFDTVLDAAGR